MRFVALGLFVGLILAKIAIAVEYKCTSGNLERKVEVAYADNERKVPCQVRYYKEGQAEPRVLWSAESDSSYCTEKAQSFLEQLKGWGWNCAGDETAAKAASGEGAPAAAAPSKSDTAPKPGDEGTKK